MTEKFTKLPHSAATLAVKEMFSGLMGPEREKMSERPGYEECSVEVMDVEEMNASHPDLAREFERVGLSVKLLSLAVIQPGKMGWIRKKNRPEKGGILVIPIKGNSLGEYRWYDEDFVETIYTDEAGAQTVLTELETTHGKQSVVPSISSGPLDTPAVIRASEWNRLDNSDNTEYRYEAIVYLNNECSYEELVEKVAKLSDV